MHKANSLFSIRQAEKASLPASDEFDIALQDVEQEV
jgi:hypothetical protein